MCMEPGHLSPLVYKLLSNHWGDWRCQGLSLITIKFLGFLFLFLLWIYFFLKIIYGSWISFSLYSTVIPSYVQHQSLLYVFLFFSYGLHMSLRLSAQEIIRSVFPWLGMFIPISFLYAFMSTPASCFIFSICVGMCIYVIFSFPEFYGMCAFCSHGAPTGHHPKYLVIFMLLVETVITSKFS